MNSSGAYSNTAIYDRRRLKVSDLHELHIEQSGNPDGIPVVVLHGGPGVGLIAEHRKFFDPQHYRVIMFDQRGAGLSSPFGEIRENTTPHLVADMEAIRRFLDIDRWIVFGGSWGTTLGLAYAQSHPEPVLGLVLRGIFLCRKSEIEWFLYGMRHMAPDAWQTFSGYIPEPERHDLLEAYHKRLMDPDPDVHMPAARSWSAYEAKTSTLLYSPDLVRSFTSDRVALGLARFEAHYFSHGIFLPENALLDNMERVRPIPGIIIQGRYDLVCPPVSAHDLAEAWPEAKYVVVPDAGHSATEPGIGKALLEAMEEFKLLA